MTPLLIIDGYNLMHAAGLMRVTFAPEILRRRSQLLRLLASSLPAHQRQRTAIVFDATDPAIPDSLPARIHEMLVTYAPDEGDADLEIEQMIREHSAPRTLCVVSGDRRLQSAARRRRGRFVKSADFLRLLAHSRQEWHRDRVNLPPEKLSGPLTPDEVQFWMAEFADIDPESIQESTQPDRLANFLAHEDTNPAGQGSPLAPTASPRQQQANRDVTIEDEINFWELRLAEVLNSRSEEVD